MIGITMPSGESSLWSGALKPTDFSYDKPPCLHGNEGSIGLLVEEAGRPLSGPFYRLHKILRSGHQIGVFWMANMLRRPNVAWFFNEGNILPSRQGLSRLVVMP